MLMTKQHTRIHSEIFEWIAGQWLCELFLDDKLVTSMVCRSLEEAARWCNEMEAKLRKEMGE